MIVKVVHCTRGLTNEESRGWHLAQAPLTKIPCAGARLFLCPLRPPKKCLSLPLLCQACLHSTPFIYGWHIFQIHTTLFCFLAQCFSNFNVHINDLGILLKGRTSLRRSRRKGTYYISNKLSSDTNAANPQVTPTVT